MKTKTPQHDELVTPRELAKALRVDVKTTTRWAAEGKLRSVRTLGGHRRFFRADLEAILRGETPQPSAKAA
jgi:excisionase family DNA binding protein